MKVKARVQFFFLYNWQVTINRDALVGMYYSTASHWQWVEYILQVDLGASDWMYRETCLFNGAEHIDLYAMQPIDILVLMPFSVHVLYYFCFV